MRTINKRYSKYHIGQKVIVKKEYKGGGMYLYIGEVGTIEAVDKMNVPDFGLVDVDVLDIRFARSTIGSGGVISWGSGLVEEYLELL
jgi:hypothetical protein